MALSKRKVCLWIHLELKLHHVEEKWEATIKEDEDSYTLNGIHDNVVEKKCNSKLMVSGPLIHVYLKELGSLMLHKLCRGKMTGIQSANAILIPWQVMVNLMKLAQGYGATITSECKKNKEKVFTVLINSEICGNKLWHPKRLGEKCSSKENSPKAAVVYICMQVSAKWLLQICHQ